MDSLLPTSEQGTFDIVLLLGPLYHIMDSELREAHYRDLATREPERLERKKEPYEKHALDGYIMISTGDASIFVMISISGEIM